MRYVRRYPMNLDITHGWDIPGRKELMREAGLANDERLSLSYELAADRIEFDRQFWMYLEPDLDDDLEPIAGHRTDVRGTICPCGRPVVSDRGMREHLLVCDGLVE